MALQGELVTLRPLSRADLDEIEAWTPYTDPLFIAYNRLPWQRMGKDLWHALEAADPGVERYAIVDRQGRIVGILGLLDVAEPSTPLLSILLGADFVDRGLGTDALRVLLGHAFSERKLRAVRLEVAATNLRARQVYEKCGFRITGQRYRPLETGLAGLLLQDPRYREFRRYLKRRHGQNYVLTYEMQVRAEDWRSGHQCH